MRFLAAILLCRWLLRLPASAPGPIAGVGRQFVRNADAGAVERARSSRAADGHDRAALHDFAQDGQRRPPGRSVALRHRWRAGR